MQTTVQHPENQATIRRSNAFNELEILRMIPAVIKRLKKHKLSESDQNLLRSTFGDLWQLIEEEANRLPNIDINPLLKPLLYAQRKHRNKRKSFHHIGNDIEFNTIDQIFRSKPFAARNAVPRGLAKLRMRTNLSPAQRLLKVAAILIHDSLVRNYRVPTRRKSKEIRKRMNRYRNRIHKKQLRNPERNEQMHVSDEPNLNVPKIDDHLTTTSRSRMKRNVNYAGFNEDYDAENVLRQLIAPDAEEDYSYNDYDFSTRAPEEKKQHQQMKREEQKQQSQQQEQDDEQQLPEWNFEYPDYAFDTTDFDEDSDLLRNFYGQVRRSAYDDYEYDSFSDMMRRAAEDQM